MRQSFMVVLLCAAAFPEAAMSAGDTVQAVLADCGHFSLAASAIDSCLERARIFDETNPSPQLETLIARLESDSTGRSEAAPSGADVGGDSAEAGVAVSSRSSGSPRPLGADAAEVPVQRRIQAPDESADTMDDDDVPPVDDAPQASGQAQGIAPADDKGDDDNGEPPD